MGSPRQAGSAASSSDHGDNSFLHVTSCTEWTVGLRMLCCVAKPYPNTPYLWHTAIVTTQSMLPGLPHALRWTDVWLRVEERPSAKRAALARQHGRVSPMSFGVIGWIVGGRVALGGSPFHDTGS